jgi:2OG-Fe(II) oxygenase superfamily
VEEKMKEQKIAHFNPDKEVDYTPYKVQFEKIGNDSNAVHLIHNFISKEDLDTIYSYLESYKDDPNFKGGNDKNYETVLSENPKVAELLVKYRDLIWKEVQARYENVYDVKYSEEPTNALHFVKWTAGMKTPLHSDCERPDGSPAFHAGFYKLNLSILGYINDNYEGGEIEFPEHGIKIKPFAGDLIMFPSNGAFRHQVNEVFGENNRYTMPCWYKFDLPDIYKKENYVADATDSVILWVNDGDNYEHINHF